MTQQIFIQELKIQNFKDMQINIQILSMINSTLH